MSTTNSIVAYLESLSAQGEWTEKASDAHLLTDFIENRSEGSLAALVQRHGAMVYRLCLRSLGHCQDAEDAFQATFLVMARKAHSIRKKSSVASWLHGVSFRVASRLRQKRKTIRNRERQVEALPETESFDPDFNRELDHRIDEELAKLPSKLREAIVLCDLEGLTQVEAARRFGCPEGTLSARLTRGRRLLARRLSRKGVTFGGALLGTLLTTQAGTALTYRLLSSTTRGVFAHATGTGSVTELLSANAISPAEGVCQTMFRSKLNALVAVVLAVGVAVGTATAVMQPRPVDEPIAYPVQPNTMARQTQESQEATKPQPKVGPGEPTVRFGTSKFRWGGRISSLEYSADGKRLLSAGGTWGAAVWDAETGDLIRHVPGSSAWTVADFSPDGKRVALAGYHEGPVPVWDVESGTQLSTIQKGSKAARFSADGKTVFTVSDHTLTGFDAATGKPLPPFADHGEGRSMIAVAPKSTLIAANDPRGNLWVWDWKTGKQIASTDGIGTGVHNQKDLTFTPNGKSLIVITAGIQKGAELRDARTLELIRQFTAGEVNAIAVSSDGKQVAFAGFQGEVKLFDLKSGEQVKAWQAHSEPNHISSLAFSPDGKRLACGTDFNGEVKIWDLATTKELFPHRQGHRASVSKLVMHKDGTLISQGSWQLGRWDLATNKPIKFWGWSWPKYLSPHWAYSSATDRTLVGNESLYLGKDPSNPKNTFIDVFAKAKTPREGGRKEAETIGNENRIYEMAMSADGGRSAVATGDDRIIVCDLDPIKYVRTFTMPKVQHLAWDREYSIALTPDGAVLAGAAQDKVQLWEVKTGKTLPSPKTGFDVQHLAFSPDGKTLALAGYQAVMLWNAEKGAVHKMIPLKKNGVRSIAFSPDSKTLATGSVENVDVVTLWDLATGKEVGQLRGAHGGAQSLVFRPDGKTLYAGTGSSQIVGWKLGRE